jgi:hypothetical protein
VLAGAGFGDDALCPCAAPAARPMVLLILCAGVVEVFALEVDLRAVLFTGVCDTPGWGGRRSASSYSNSAMKAGSWRALSYSTRSSSSAAIRVSATKMPP